MIRSSFFMFLFSLSINSVTSAGMILNGSFESPGFTHSSSADNFRYLLDNGDTSISDWTITRAQVVGEQVYWFHSSRFPTFDGQYALNLTDAGRASTLVTVDANQQYLLSFYSTRDITPPVSNFALDVNIGPISTTLFPSDGTDTGIQGVSGQNWLKFDYLFTPTIGGPQILALFNVPDGIGSFDGGITIDAVSVTAVPEPSSVALIAIGAVGYVVRSRIRRRL